MQSHTCPVCRNNYGFNRHCGLRLYNCDSKCPICLEKKESMVALHPCGHIVCIDCFCKLGLVLLIATPVRPPIRLPAAPRRPPRVLRYRVRRRKRCGWCGLRGHKVNQCKKHIKECGCSTFNTPRHKLKHSRKRTCTTCRHKGHTSVNCFR